MAKAKVPTKRYYWDSAVFVSLIEKTPKRIATIDALLDDCDAKKIEIWTSHLTIAEVAFAKAEKDGKALDPEVEEAIKDLWHVESPIKLVEVSQPICELASSFVRRAMALELKLGGADAVHLATAIFVKATELHTYDKPLKRCDGVFEMNINDPWTQAPFFSALEEKDNATKGASASRPERIRRADTSPRTGAEGRG